MGFKGWAIFMDCDMLCRSDIGDLWNLRDDKYSLMCVKHNHIPSEENFRVNYKLHTQGKIGVL